MAVASSIALALVPLAPVIVLVSGFLSVPGLFYGKVEWNVSDSLWAYLAVAAFGYLATYTLVPHIQQYTLRKGISGKDLGKRGTPLAETPV